MTIFVLSTPVGIAPGISVAKSFFYGKGPKSLDTFARPDPEASNLRDLYPFTPQLPLHNNNMLDYFLHFQ